jgi:hypothetical protein
LGASETLVFKVKKLPKVIKDLKTFKSEAQKLKKKTMAAKKRVAAAIAMYLQKANGSPLTPPGVTSSEYVALDLCYKS